MNPLQANHLRTAAIAGTCVNCLWGTFLPGNRLDNQHGSYRVSQTTPSLSASRRDSYSGSPVKIGSTSGQAVEMLVHVLVRSCASKVLMHACCAAICAALGLGGCCSVMPLVGALVVEVSAGGLWDGSN